MVHYDGTVRNSLGDLIQFMYGEDGMDGAFIERQKIETFGLDNEAFEHNYRVDVTDGKNGFLPNTLQIGVDDSSLELQMKLDEEYNELLNDCHLLREFVFPQPDCLTSQGACYDTRLIGNLLSDTQISINTLNPRVVKIAQIVVVHTKLFRDMQKKGEYSEDD
jgi:hypothetical protein